MGVVIDSLGLGSELNTNRLRAHQAAVMALAMVSLFAPSKQNPCPPGCSRVSKQVRDERVDKFHLS